MDGHGPVVETLAQDWSPLDREVQHDECADCHQRTSAWLGWSRGQNGLLGDLREGQEMSGTSVVEMAAAPLETSEERQVGSNRTPKRFKIYRWEDMVSTEVSKVCGNADGFAESVQLSTGWSQLAEDRGHWQQFAKFWTSTASTKSLW